MSRLRILPFGLLRYNSEFFVGEFRTYRNKKCCNLENSSRALAEEQQSYVGRPVRLHGACIDQLAENYSDSLGRAGETCRSAVLRIPCSSRHFSKCGPTIHAGQRNVETLFDFVQTLSQGRLMRFKAVGEFNNPHRICEIHRLVRSTKIYN